MKSKFINLKKCVSFWSNVESVDELRIFELKERLGQADLLYSKFDKIQIQIVYLVEENKITG